MKALRILLVPFLILTLAIVIHSCSTTGGGDDDDDTSAVTYGGTDPQGDYIVITLDRDAGTVIHQNFTTGETNGPYAYAQETDINYNKGFSILYRVNLPASEGGGFVLFAEYPNTALVYQMFDASEDPQGDPVYAVYAQSVDKTSFYGKAYNWMKFFIDTSAGTEDDMSVGFAAYDDASANGLMYGASYSKKSEVEEGGPDYGIGDINEGDTVSVNAMTYDSSSLANIMWFDGVGNWDDAIAITGTASGASILDFGPDIGGGGALVVPQTDLADNEAGWFPTLNGTYFMMVYSAASDGSFKGVEPMKLVFENGTIKVFEYEDRTDGTPDFTDTIQKVSATDGPRGGENVSTSFANDAGNSAATSTVVQNAHLCKGAYVAVDEGGDEWVITMIFDPEGRFMGFTGFFKDPSFSYDYEVRFGFGIKDAGYSNDGL